MGNKVQEPTHGTPGGAEKISLLAFTFFSLGWHGSGQAVGPDLWVKGRRKKENKI